MPRKGPAPKRAIVIDPVYDSTLVTQLVNKVLTDGKRSTAEGIVYGALEGCRGKTGRSGRISRPSTRSRRSSSSVSTRKARSSGLTSCPAR